VPANDFHVLLTEAVHADERHGLPSALLKIPASGSATLAKVSPLLPDTAITSTLSGTGEIAILLPFSGLDTASELAQKISTALSGVRPQLFPVTGDLSPEALWTSLHSSHTAV
jgi:hypothetical protein